jgi:hypothetical protein
MGVIVTMVLKICDHPLHKRNERTVAQVADRVCVDEKEVVNYLSKEIEENRQSFYGNIADSFPTQW